MLRDRLRARAEAAGLDGLLLLAPGNVVWATGWAFSANERPLGLWLPVEGDAVLMVPSLEVENAADVPGVGLRSYDEYPGETPPVLWMIAEARAQRIGVERLDARLLAPAQDVARIDLTDHATPERAVKHPEELALIREAARFADMVLDRLLTAGGDIVAQGGTELDLMADATSHAEAALMTTHGAAFQGTKLGITASVHSGPRAALPHGAVLPRTPSPGEPVIAGIGCAVGGYHAESGATFVMGQPSPEHRRIMAAMDSANAACAEALCRGLDCAGVNTAALEPIRAAGLGEAIRHRIGHGMGVEGHEAPWLAPGDRTPAAPGMVFSCEPGVYRPGHDGWRSIETFIIAPDGVEIASRFQTRTPSDIRIIPV
ncbi:aminopeptidase P family protein [Paracoccus suum]|uniref:Aminopeptidase P family protein n=2 Tax=Paracoccus suum TaxID=2259340 RepID=A0A344PGD3_9RHOB|nr:aminopeptidase P family protein [Paracoccus suum]